MDNHNPTPQAASSPPSFVLTRTWPQQISATDRADLLTFWTREDAIPSLAQAQARVDQVVFLARDAAGDIAGVCTVLPMTPAQLAQPLYFWRAFVTQKWRSSRLVGTLLSKSCEMLAIYAREHDYPAIGVLLELENDRFRNAGRKAQWVHPLFAYIGKSPRGLDVRVHYFKGARLK